MGERVACFYESSARDRGTKEKEEERLEKRDNPSRGENEDEGEDGSALSFISTLIISKGGPLSSLTWSS